MKRKILVLPLLLISSLLLSACLGLIPLENDATPVTEYGPQDSLTELQTRTFDALWTSLADNYIYYDTADVNWDAIHADIQKKIDAGLNSSEFESLLGGLADQLPPGSLVYQSRADKIKSDITDASSYEGIGAFVGFSAEPQPHIILLSIIDGSPAEKAGLKAHDSILAIDGKPVLLEEGLRAVERVRGPSGTTVTLNIKSPGSTEHDVKVQRGKLVSTAKLEAHQIQGTNYGYLLFPPIAYDNLMTDVLSALQTFSTDQKLGGLILDLRIANPNSNWPLEAMSALFTDGKVGDFYDRAKKQTLQVQGQDVLGSQTVPLVVLTGSNTLGFPEILAGSLQANKRAVIVGSSTPGGVETSASYFLPDGSRAFIATTSFVLPNGDDIGINGVKPDVRVEAGWDDILPNQDPVLDAALQVLESQS